MAPDAQRTRWWIGIAAFAFVALLAAGWMLTDVLLENHGTGELTDGKFRSSEDLFAPAPEQPANAR